MNGQQFAATISAALTRLAQSAEELRDLDADLGDGDLGITVGSGAKAVVAALADVPNDVTPAEVLRKAAKAFASANPSTMAALTGGALLAASKQIADATDITPAEAITIGRAAAESIMARGKSAVGDKTILDALVPALDAAEGADDPLTAAVAAAALGVEQTAGQQSQKGRAAWQGERSVGKRDPGAVALWRFLQALAAGDDTVG